MLVGALQTHVSWSFKVSVFMKQNKDQVLPLYDSRVQLTWERHNSIPNFQNSYLWAWLISDSHF